MISVALRRAAKVFILFHWWYTNHSHLIQCHQKVIHTHYTHMRYLDEGLQSFYDDDVLTVTKHECRDESTDLISNSREEIFRTTWNQSTTFPCFFFVVLLCVNCTLNLTVNIFEHAVCVWCCVGCLRLHVQWFNLVIHGKCVANFW